MLNLESALRYESVVAIYRNRRSGEHTAICKNVHGGIYEYQLDYKGMYPAAAASLICLSALKHMEAEDTLEWVKTPNHIFPVWHICMCTECAVLCGVVWEHSHVRLDGGHLKDVDDEKMGTFRNINVSRETMGK